MMFNKAIISSLNGTFETYTIKNVIAINYTLRTLTITYIEGSDITVLTALYNTEDVIVNIA